MGTPELSIMESIIARASGYLPMPGPTAQTETLPKKFSKTG